MGLARHRGQRGKRAPSISSDGRYIAFESAATNLVADDLNGIQDIFVHDRIDGTTIRISVDSAGTEGDGISAAPSISSDGRYVAFDSAAGNLVAGDLNGVRDVFIHDRDTYNDGIFDEEGATDVSLASIDSDGIQGDSTSSDPFISSDGRYITYESSATNLVADDLNGVQDIFVYRP